MNINEIQSPKIKSTDEVYNILDNVECGPFDGGCVLIAQALKKIHGGDIVVLVNKKGIADHAAVKVGNKLIDFDGALPVKQFVKRFEKNEHTTIKSIRAIKKNDLPDAPRNKEIVPQLVNALSESKLSEGYKLKLERDTDMMVLHINAGQGTKAMQDIVDRMDREGAIIALTPDDAFGGNKNRLIKFYKRFGFVPNKGRNKDFRFRETMIRYPQSNKSVNEVSKEEFDAIQNGYVDIEFDKKWWPLNDDYPLIKHIGNAISATSWTSWGKVGVPWSETEMIGGGGTYMLKGDFGHILLDTAKSYRPDKIVMSQISTSKRGGGIGAKVMNAIKSYSDQNKLPLTIYKVTNQKFFDKFEWLEKTGVDTYEYSSNEVKESAGVGRVVKGVNTTVDVGVDEIINQVKKFGNDVDRDGKPKKNLRNK